MPVRRNRGSLVALVMSHDGQDEIECEIYHHPIAPSEKELCVMSDGHNTDDLTEGPENGNGFTPPRVSGLGTPENRDQGAGHRGGGTGGWPWVRLNFWIQGGRSPRSNPG